MRRDATAALLLIAGGVVLQVVLSGEYTNYVRPGHGPWLVVVGVALAVAGIAGLVTWLRDRERGLDDDAAGPARPAAGSLARLHTHGPLAVSREELAAARAAAADAADPLGGDDAHGHDHRRGPAVGWLLCLPLLLVLLIPPPALGAWAAARAGAAVPLPTPTARHPGPLPAGDPVALPVHAYAERATWDAGRTLAGRTVDLTGFVTPDPAGGWYVTRAVITCCAADARSYLVKVTGPVPALPTDTWVRVVGRAVPAAGTDPATAVAQVEALSVTTTPAPSDPYEP